MRASALIVKQRVGLTDVEIDYARPNKNNREIFGDSRSPREALADRRERDDADQVQRHREVRRQGGAGGRIRAVHDPERERVDRDLVEGRQGQSAAEYKQENDAARITVKPETLPIAVETFTIGLDRCEGRIRDAQPDVGQNPRAGETDDG